MKRIKLTGRNGIGKFALVDTQDFERCSAKSWYVSSKGRPKAIHKMDGKWKQVTMHRFILNFPVGKLIDHIDGNPLNNQRENLRLCSIVENHYNRRPCAKSGFKGVRPSGTLWEARITLAGKAIILGSFKEKTEAAMAYNAAAKKYFGEFAWLNPV